MAEDNPQAGYDDKPLTITVRPGAVVVAVAAQLAQGLTPEGAEKSAVLLLEAAKRARRASARASTP